MRCSAVSRLAAWSNRARPTSRKAISCAGAYGYRERYVADAKHLAKVDADPKLPLTVYMHVMGGAGFVAYGGLMEIGKLKSGEQVFVSTAAGSVGSLASQIAKLKGCTVVGSTGSDDKAVWLKSARSRRGHQLQEGTDPRRARKGDAERA